MQAGVGKASFTEDAIVQNVKTFVDSVIKAKPQGAKGTYMKKISITSTMGPGVKIALAVGRRVRSAEARKRGMLNSGGRSPEPVRDRWSPQRT